VSPGWSVIGPVDVACTPLRKLPDLYILGGAAGNRTRCSTRAFGSELRVRSVWVRFSPARYLRFRSRVLTASREVNYQSTRVSHFVSDCAKGEADRARPPGQMLLDGSP
jgi:hypothetical protein